MNITIHMIGGGRLGLGLEADGLEDVADILRRERGLLGDALPNDDGEVLGRVLVPAHRIQLVTEG
ncbi:hypothetical protein Q0812_08715 [Brevundimonas sp. 2R-24]|uniref:Uncharacterized protein n=1 Tax=Peiella sedimenti TaxID=3061083 RepID=A0ABT8SQ78_9CAUL|nr:hypothetical protein [Caulobacteraceae bacterium XZ-24]